VVGNKQISNLLTYIMIKWSWLLITYIICLYVC